MHSHISKAVEDCNISDDEYKLVLDEVEKYCAMKEDLLRKHTAGSLIDEKTENELMKLGRNQAQHWYSGKAGSG